MQLKGRKQHVQVVQVFVENLPYLRIVIAEIDYNVGFVFVLSKCLGNVTFPNTSWTVNQNGHFALSSLLPIE